MLRVRIAVSALIVVTTVAGVALSAVVFDTRILPSGPRIGAQNAFNTRNLIRLHVVANSDSHDDQALKLEVRDAILARAKELLDSVETKEEAWRALLKDADKLQAAAMKRIRAAGKSYDARVEMGTFAFPERTYGSVTVPSGNYDAVRVVLGEGEGRNWWCVLFPPLCFIQVNKEREVQGLTLDLSPGEALAKLRLDLAGPSHAGQAARASRARPEAGIMASPPALRPPAPGVTRLWLPLTSAPRAARPSQHLSPFSDGLARLSLALIAG